MSRSSVQWLAIAVMAVFVPRIGLSQIEFPQLSPKGKLEQKVGVMSVSVSYSRPGIKGRKIFGGLVPYGQEWRTGANDRTTLTFSDSVKLEGHTLPAGTYALFTIPGEQEWTIIINKGLAGGIKRDEKDDLVKFNVTPVHTSTPVETFTIDISDVAMSSANVELAWENTVVKFRMEFDVDGRVEAGIRKAMENPLAGAASMYFQSASYYFNAKKDMKTALDWVNKSIEINKNSFTFWRLKSQIQAELKDYKGAIASAETSLSKATEAGNKEYVKFNEDAIAEWSAKK